MPVSHNALTLARLAERLATGRMTAAEHEFQVQRQRRKGRGARRRRYLKQTIRLLGRNLQRGWISPEAHAARCVDMERELASLQPA